MSSPLIQLERSESLLRQLLLKKNLDIPISGSVVFINPEFTLYQAPMDKPFIFPSQFNRLIKNLNSFPSILNAKQKIIADQLLMSTTLEEHPLQKQQYPDFSFSDLHKGIKCLACDSFSVNLANRFNIICSICLTKEPLDRALFRTMKDFQILFPDDKMTISNMFEWCNSTISRKSLRRFLNKHFNKIRESRWIYYQ